MTLYSLQVIAERLSEEEIAGLKEMFKMIDADNSGHITLEELKIGLEKVGANIKESDINDLMQAVSAAKLLHLSELFVIKPTYVVSMVGFFPISIHIMTVQYNN